MVKQSRIIDSSCSRILPFKYKQLLNSGIQWDTKKICFKGISFKSNALNHWSVSFYVVDAYPVCKLYADTHLSVVS